MENSIPTLQMEVLRLPELCDPPKITQLGCGKARIPTKACVNSGSVIFSSISVAIMHPEPKMVIKNNQKMPLLF